MTIKKGSVVFIACLVLFFVYLAGVNAQTTFQISGFVFEDLNRDANWDSGEPKLSGRVVELYTGLPDPQATPPYCCNEDTGRRYTTDSSGNYIFTDLTAGVNWRVRHLPPSGYEITSDDSPYYGAMSTS